MHDRYLEGHIQRDLDRKMVFLGGPRQVGKTTLARSLLGQDGQGGYLNWDVAEHRERILRRELPRTPTLVLDEIHKHRPWRSYVKGLFDDPGHNTRIMVTGSARLDYYRHGGDSLQGRYHYWRLHPFSVAELRISTAADFGQLLTLGGFPEPFLGGTEVDARRWSREYRTRLLQEDILGVEQIRDIGTLELLVLRLPELVGSPLSINALREDLQVNFRTVARWLDSLERMYAVFRVAPFGAPRLRAVKKEQKHYHFDWQLVADPGARFENLVASHLLKWIHFLQDSEGRDIELRYFRDVDRREVDFVVTENRAPILFVETKLSERTPDRSLSYLSERFPDVRAVQLHATEIPAFRTPAGITVMPAWEFLAELV